MAERAPVSAAAAQRTGVDALGGRAGNDSAVVSELATACGTDRAGATRAPAARVSASARTRLCRREHARRLESFRGRRGVPQFGIAYDIDMGVDN